MHRHKKQQKAKNLEEDTFKSHSASAGTGPYSSSFISSVTFASSSLSASAVAFASVALPSVALTSVAFVAFASMTTGFFFALRRAARTTVGLSFALSSATRKAGSSWFLSFF